MISRMASTTIIFFLTFSILPLLNFVSANNGCNPEPSSVQCPPPPPCVCVCNPTPPLLPPPPGDQAPPPPTIQPAPPPKPPPPPPAMTTPPPATTTLPPLSPPNRQPPPLPHTTQPPQPDSQPSPPTTQPTPPPNAQPLPPLQTTPPPPPGAITPPFPPANTPSPPAAITPPTSPPTSGLCSKNDAELKICNNILIIADSNLSTGRAEPCCSIIRNLSDVDAVTCLCKSVEARRSSLSPNFNIFFKTCGRRIPQGFSCPGPSPKIPPPPPLLPTTTPPLPPPQATPPPPLATISPPSPPSSGICSKNDAELKICNNILIIYDGNLNAGRGEPCCSIIRNLSDVDAVTCLCKSVNARRFSLSPNFNIFFRTCGRRIPQGFSCPGSSPTISPPPFLPTIAPPLPTPPPPPPATIPPPSPPSGGICSRNDAELQICNNILIISDGNLNAGRGESCCSIIRNLFDVDTVTCLCKSVNARRFSLSPNFNIFFTTCGRRIPQGFSCPGPSPTISPPTIAPPLPTPPPPPPATIPPPSPPSGGMCSRNDAELQICNNILIISDGNLNAGRGESCCSIIRNLSDVDAVTCLCKSVNARRFSLSPNFNIFFRTCGRRIPQGFSCPGPSPTISPPPFLPTIAPPLPTPPPPATIPPPSPPSGGICSRNDAELQICNNILIISDGNLNAGRGESCCSIIRNLSDVDVVTCLCKSVNAQRFSLSPNFNIFFRTCGRRIPQGFTCPGPSPKIPPPPFLPTIAPPLPTPPPLPSTIPLPSPPSSGICSRNDVELKICNNILVIADGNLSTGRAEPCCSIIRNLSDVEAVTCLCKSFEARRSSLSPNFNIFFRTCGRRIPQGFSCP